MEFKGTKGKWECVNAENRICISAKSNIGFIDVWGGGIMGVNNEQMQANAKLIASAPEMFEMLKDILKMQITDYAKLEIEKLLTKITQ